MNLSSDAEVIDFIVQQHNNNKTNYEPKPAKSFLSSISNFVFGKPDEDNEGDLFEAPREQRAGRSAAFEALSGMLTKTTQSSRTKQIAPGFSIVNNRSRVTDPAVQAQVDKATQHETASPTSNNTLSDADSAIIKGPIAAWLKVQASFTPSQSIEACISETLTGDDGKVVESSRRYVFFPKHSPTTSATHSAHWLTALNCLRRHGIPHSGAASAGNVAFNKTAHVVTLKQPMMICLDLARHDETFIPALSKAPFPPVDDSIVNVKSIKVLSATATTDLLNKVVHPSQVDTTAIVAKAFADRVQIPDSAETVVENAHRLKANVWHQHARTQQDIDDFLENPGARVAPTVRDLDKTEHRAFRSLVAEAFGSYTEADPAKRAEMASVLFAIPSLHLRVLHGKHSNHIRNAHRHSQLQGNVCTQLEKPKAPAPQRTIDPSDFIAVSEAKAKTVAKAMGQVVHGSISEANKTLKRASNINPPPRPDMDQLVADLEKLHPDGPAPTNIQLPAEPLYNATVVPVQAVRDVVNRKCNASSPGPSGWTPELLRIALFDAQFATAFRDFIVDICNGALPPSTDMLLSMSNLVGIPKDSGGTRPIAMGETFLKIATDIALQRNHDVMKGIFKNTQLGVSRPGGAEYAVHKIRDFIVNGAKPNSTDPAGPQRVVVTLDAKNAFNMPYREAMHQALINANLPGLMGIFKTAYAQHGNMYVVGSNGTRIIKSKRGARQGTVDGSMLFSTLLQPALDHIDENMPETDPAAYLDDTTLCSDHLRASHEAVVYYQQYLHSHGAELQPKKCEIVLPALVHNGNRADYEKRVKTELDLAGIPADSPLRSFKIVSAVKLLGASVSTTRQEEDEHLYDRLVKTFDSHIDQISLLPASPQAFALIRLCLLPSLSYHLRVHHPEVSARLARHCDARVQFLIESWAQSKPFGLKQNALLRATRAQGGLGIPSLAATAAPAYASSIIAADSPLGAKGLPSQGLIVKASQAIWTQQLLHIDSSIAEMLAHLKAANGSLGFSPSTRVAEEDFAAFLRFSTASAPEGILDEQARYPCPGCTSISVGRKANNIAAAAANQGKTGKLYTVQELQSHAIGCVAIPGGAVVKRHNSVRDYIFNLLKLGSYSNVELEPRKLRQYDCHCGLKALPHETYAAHRKTCEKATTTLQSHGPDILYTDISGSTIAIDVRICNDFSESSRQKPLAQIFTEAENEKKKKYGDICAKAGVTLLTFCVSAMGALSTASTALLRSIAKDHPDLDFQTMCSTVSARAAAGSAQALRIAESHLGIQPAPRAISLVVLKMLEATLGLPLTKPEDIRLGVPAPTNTQLTDVLSRLEALLDKFPIDSKSVFSKADEIKAQEAEEAARLAALIDPTAIVGPHNVERLPSVDPARLAADNSPQREKSVSAAEQRRRSAVSAAQEAREYNLVNSAREVELQLEAIRATTDARISLAHQQVEALHAEIEHIQARADAINEVANSENHATEQTTNAIDEQTRRNRQAADEVRAESERLSSEMRNVVTLSAARDSARKSLSEARQYSEGSVGARANHLKQAHDELKRSETDLRMVKKEHSQVVQQHRDTCNPASDEFITPARSCHLGPVDIYAVPQYSGSQQKQQRPVQNQQQSALYLNNSSSGCQNSQQNHHQRHTSSVIDPSIRIPFSQVRDDSMTPFAPSSRASNSNNNSSNSTSVAPSNRNNSNSSSSQQQGNNNTTNTFTTSSTRQGHGSNNNNNNNKDATTLPSCPRPGNNSNVQGTNNVNNRYDPDFSPDPCNPITGRGQVRN